MRVICAIDPGATQSAWVLFGDHAIHSCGIDNNLALIDRLRAWRRLEAATTLVIEEVQSFGMPVGRDVFQTCVWSGRFIQAWDKPYRTLGRREIKLELCGSARAKDANVRQALIDDFAATGRGKTPQVGTKAKPGPLYGVSKDIWSALAVAVVYQRQWKRGKLGQKGDRKAPPVSDGASGRGQACVFIPSSASASAQHDSR